MSIFIKENIGFKSNGRWHIQRCYKNKKFSKKQGKIHQKKTKVNWAKWANIKGLGVIDLVLYYGIGKHCELYWGLEIIESTEKNY